MVSSIFVAVASFSIGIVLAWIIRKLLFEKNYVAKEELIANGNKIQELAIENGKLEVRHNLVKENEAKLKASLIESQSNYEKINEKLIHAEALNSHLVEKQETQTQDMEKIGQKFETNFKLLASQILDQKTEQFNRNQEAGLDAILKPLKDNIKTFKEEFETKYKTESDDRISLREQIKHMMDLNKTLSSQADNLTKALTNNVKQQGDWGEEILESILEYAGLQKNIQYFVQQQSQNNEGVTIRPDIILKYPDGRSLVIDSKVSLVHYSRFCSTDNQAEQSTHLSQMLNSIKQHIDGLSRKDYHDVTDALDLVLMFVPNEAAYIKTMQADHELWHYAFKKRVMLISATNLIPALKLVADMWQKDAIGKNAMEIADKAGKIYDKLAGFVENFEKIGGQIEKAHNSWTDAQKQLHKGKGNLLSQAEQMKRMQVKTSKQLSPTLIEYALFEDGIEPEDTTESTE